MNEHIRILCVDDEKNVLSALERLFLDDDYEILTSSSGDEGLEVLRNISPIQIIISDYRMPGMNGVDFLKEVNRNWPETVRIVLSGYADTTSVVSAINEGQIYKFIPKPWNDDELKVTIANAIERYELYKQNIYYAEELKRYNEELQNLNNNFEKLIEERVSELVVQNNMLTCAQNILDSLPVAVIGIDSDGLIVLCNRKGNELFLGDKGIILGMDRRDALPGYVNNVVERVFEKKKLSGHVLNKNRRVLVRGVLMKYPDERDGVVLVFDPEEKIV